MAYAVLTEEFEVVPRLVQLRLPKDVMLDVFDRAAGERASVSNDDPVATPGNEMRRWMTRFLRQNPVLKELGWVACAHRQIEGIRNDELKLKLVPLNTDARAGMPSQQPTSVSERGPAVEKLIQANCGRGQANLFGEYPIPAPDPLDDYELFYFCVHATEKALSAEISRPVGLTAGFVSSFSERIILSQPGEKPGLRPAGGVEEDFAEIEKPTIIRKG